MASRTPATALLRVSVSQPTQTRVMHVLMIGHGLGWWLYLVGDTTAGRYTVILPDRRVRVLGEAEVLPWVLGYADRLGPDAVERIRYRDDL